MIFPKNCHKCPVWEKSLFREFDAALVAWLAKKKQPNILGKKELLFIQGQRVEGIFCHLHGLTKIVEKDEQDKIRFSRLVLPGDTSGHRSLFVEETYKGTANIISDSVQACFIPKTDILYLLANNASFAKNLVVKIATDMERLKEDKVLVREKTVRVRLAHLLCDFCDEYADQIDENSFMVSSEISKRDIANLLSVANETVIRLMSEMKSDGLIAYQGKILLIQDYAGMKKVAKR